MEIASSSSMPSSAGCPRGDGNQASSAFSQTAEPESTTSTRSNTAASTDTKNAAEAVMDDGSRGLKRARGTGDDGEDGDACVGECPFSIAVCSPDFKFSCAHFVAFRGFRERLHGHNYTVALRLGGPLGSDGYVMNFGDVKAALRKVCKSLNEFVIIPMRSDVLDILVSDEKVLLTTEDEAHFQFPRSDCLCLPIIHSTAEELACYIWFRLVEELTLEQLKSRFLSWMEVAVAERPTQEAKYVARLTPSQVLGGISAVLPHRSSGASSSS